MIRHVFENVPYYRKTMEGLGLIPSDFQWAADLEREPDTRRQAVRKIDPLSPFVLAAIHSAVICW